MGMNLTRANRGRALERTILASQSLVTLVKVPHGMKYLRGGKTVGVKTLTDFAGVVKGTGQGIFFDAKMCELKNGFPIGNRSHFSEYQRQFLIRMGAAGAIAGLLVECKAHQMYAWLDWTTLEKCRAPSLAWDAAGWRWLGMTTYAVNFEQLI
jgi:penicillin-binding protein-related factor A (putative recombinase)